MGRPAKTKAQKAETRKAWLIRNKADQYAKAKARAYKISPEQVVEMIKRGVCDLCSAPCKVNIDHCHSTGQVRGGICTGCNTFLGLYEKRRHLFDKVEAYLSR